ncbi:hypothetical protein GLOIN_2v1628758 [Rhizophagus irregularis DAOM 181602=DAOM 197198]|uniref:Uncharacterized protein n=1 Tax=Rhizophagus irregularis (strain DAOM 181602 / DAOM 197198 / MUCL 43194) TaxID=747089 RepID=A0A2P4PVB1_RHIID|nr:hypothetical protein GLOIN_2v1628758 [Rhizophagus irregularis DAOM 181602=DAOM 197198]POG69314.1 hypothetical protein GLOIN_2v1628758 [Rhizophagus irregularis DAOM 181602=DAOM 197198]GET55840.1 hypothetical protein GLOIN_2v1628758 [Rhizophagus irregularis DAOM 181602=DAOM 197198]|eukprot:XP_025176180.1 hypothetical protein GLOIN_2v1628758 [Rhizophagus irregularis DAOM 181602=DAOM 197198]
MVIKDDNHMTQIIIKQLTNFSLIYISLFSFFFLSGDQFLESPWWISVKMGVLIYTYLYYVLFDHVPYRSGVRT